MMKNGIFFMGKLLKLKILMFNLGFRLGKVFVKILIIRLSANRSRGGP
jgi:hypothetical protein